MTSNCCLNSNWPEPNMCQGPAQQLGSARRLPAYAWLSDTGRASGATEFRQRSCTLTCGKGI